MADLTTNFAGIRSTNPFWLASGPPTNSGEQVMRAFDAGWGGAVWKTTGEPVANVSSRYSSVDWNGQRMVGLSNIELISDRPVEVNLREIAEVKRRYPDHALIVSIMVKSERQAWHEIVKRAEGAGADGLELNFGCPHGMNERGMGSAVGQVPEYTQRITEWVKEAARTPVLVKLTPNVTDIRAIARAARRGGADGLCAINTVNSITGIDLETLLPCPNVDGMSTHGGYAGPAVKPIALNLIQQVMSDAVDGPAVPLSGIGGIAGWRDAAEFLLMGCTSLQVCTAVMHYGYRIVEDLIDGLSNWMDGKGFASIEDLRGKSLAKMTEWKHLNLNYRVVARIDPALCIGCNLCLIACWDGAHQCIHADRVNGPSGAEGPSGAKRYIDGPVELHDKPRELGRETIAVTPSPRRDAPTPHIGPYATSLEHIPRVDETECIGCNLCSLVCPVNGCITMVESPSSLVPQSWAQRTGAG